MSICSTHKRYTGTRPPTVRCVECDLIYADELLSRVIDACIQEAPSCDKLKAVDEGSAWLKRWAGEREAADDTN